MEQTRLIRLMPRAEHDVYYIFKGAARQHNIENALLTVMPVVRARFNSFRPLVELPPKDKRDQVITCDVTFLRMDNDHYVTLNTPGALPFNVALSLPGEEGSKAVSRALVLEVDSEAIRRYWMEMQFIGQLSLKTRQGMFQALVEAHFAVDKACRNGTYLGEFMEPIVSCKFAADCFGRQVPLSADEKVYLAIAVKSVENEELCNRLQLTGQEP